MDANLDQLTSSIEKECDTLLTDVKDDVADKELHLQSLRNWKCPLVHNFRNYLCAFGVPFQFHWHLSLFLDNPDLQFMELNFERFYQRLESGMKMARTCTGSGPKWDILSPFSSFSYSPPLDPRRRHPRCTTLLLPCRFKVFQRGLFKFKKILKVCLPLPPTFQKGST